MKSNFKRIFGGLSAVLIILASVAGCTSSPAGYTIDVKTDSVLGKYLVDGEGMTLYYFTNDAENTSNASPAVIANWPVFYASEINVPSGLSAADFGTITRSDGTKQTTFKKWPLYYFVQDEAAGDVKGEGVNNVWFVVDPDNFMPPA